MLWIVFVILFWIIFLFCLIVTIVSLYAFTKMFGRRYDGNPYVHYFTAEDFEGLRAQPFSFYSDGSKLNGYIYRSDLWQGPSKGIVVFSHGFGAGRGTLLILLRSIILQKTDIKFWRLTIPDV